MDQACLGKYIQSKTIVNCFKRCKAVPDVSTGEEYEGPFAELDQT